MRWPFCGGDDAEVRTVEREHVNRDQVDATRLAAVHGEVIHLSLIVALRRLLVRVVGIRARCCELHGSESHSSGLALNAKQPLAVIEDEVVARVLTKRRRDLVPGFVQREHDCQRRVVANILGVSHQIMLRCCSDGQHQTMEDAGEEPEKGFEPLAPGLQNRCSNQLSYSGAAN